MASRKGSMMASLLLAACACLSLSAAGSSIHQHFQGSSVASALLPSITRLHDRRLSAQAVSDVPSYLIPTRLGDNSLLCVGSSCCNDDSQASPYRMQHLNSTSMLMGGSTYTTFYMQLTSDQLGCLAGSSAGPCCSSNITEIWVDVDPDLQVLYTAFNGETSNFLAQQDQFGYHITPFPGLLTSVPQAGVLLTVTVAGFAPRLCQLPDFLLGVTANSTTCEIIVRGDTADEQGGGCCPYDVAAPISPAAAPYVPPAPQCVQAITSSPFQLALQAVSAPFPTGVAQQAANYTFALLANDGQCNGTAINTCCGMTLDSLSLPLAPGVVLLATELNNAPWPLAALVPTLSGANAGGLTLTLSALGLSSGVLSSVAGGMSLVLTVQLPPTSASAATVVDICQTTRNADGSVGSCAYALSAAPGTAMCCPSGSTTAVIPASGTPTPTPAPSTGCTPTLSVPIQDTSMGFNYYNGPLAETPSSTTFQFMVYNNNLNPGSCSQQYCQNVCNWQLGLNPTYAPLLSFQSDDPNAVSGAPGAPVVDASGTYVTFTNVPASGGTLLYTVVVPVPGLTLAQLCGGSASGKACTATIRNPVVYSLVAFNQSDRLVSPNAPPPSVNPLPAMCNSGNPLSASCVRVDRAAYNLPGASALTSPPLLETVIDFQVVNHDGEAGCTPDTGVMTLTLLLASGAGAELKASNSIVPSQALFASDGSSLTWTWSPIEANSSLHYQLDLSGSQSPSSVCLQRVLPQQPDGSCVVIFTGATTCYMGWVDVPYDAQLQPLPSSAEAAPSPPSNLGSIVAPAIIVPLVVLAALLAALYVYRKRRQASAATPADGSDDMGEPLAPGAGDEASGSQLSRGSLGASGSGSGGELRVPSAAAVAGRARAAQ